MATGGGEESLSLSMGSEELVESPCSICLKDGKTLEAVCFCIECQGNLCAPCSGMHDKFPANSGHHMVVIDLGEGHAATGASQIPPEGGRTRQDEFLATLCQSYEMLCSGSDLNKVRQAFPGIGYPAMMAKNTRNDKALKDMQSKVSTVIEQLELIKTMKQEQMNNLKSLEQNDIDSVDNSRAKMITHINDLADAECVKIQARYLPVKDKITAEIIEIDEQIAVVDSDSKALGDSIDGNGVQQVHVPIDVHEIEKNTKQGSAFYQRLWNTLDQVYPKYHLDTEVEKTLQGIKSLGDFDITAELQGEIDVRLKDDVSMCDVNGSCLLADGTLVLVDADNKRLKHINLEDQKIIYCDFEGEPCAVCSTSFSEVAVTLTKEKKVQMISLIGSAIKKQSFSVEQCCRGICHVDGELFISCADNDAPDSAFIGVYTKSGVLLRKIEKDENGGRIFAAPFHITVDSDGIFHVADAERGVITMDKNGRDRSVFTDCCLEGAFGVCALDSNSLLVGGLESHNVIQVRGRSRKVTTLLNKASEIYWPLSLLYDSSRSLLIVTFQQSDSVKIYKLS